MQVHSYAVIQKISTKKTADGLSHLSWSDYKPEKHKIPC